MVVSSSNVGVDESGADDSVSPPPPLPNASKIPVVFLMSRNRSSDSPTSFVMQGFLDFILSGHEIAAELRDYVIFKVVPVANPDGVFIGNTRCNLLGQDLNRHWHDANPWAQPSVYAIRKVYHIVQ